MKLIDLKRKDVPEKGEAPTPENREYPYGLVLRLENETLAALGIKELPKVGDVCKVQGLGKITRVGESASENDEHRDVEIQLTKLALVHEGDEDDEAAFDKGFKKGPKRRAYR